MRERIGLAAAAAYGLGVLACAVIGPLVAATPAAAQSTPAPAWLQEWGAVQARAKGQPLVLLLHSLDAHEAIAREFQKRFPDIKVEMTLASPSAIAPRLLTEQKNGIFAWDSWWAATANMNSIVLPAGGFEPLTDYLILPEVKDLANWNVPDYLYTSPRGAFVFMHAMHTESSTFFNRDAVKGFELMDYDGLLDPRLKGRIALRDPSKPSASSNALAVILRDKGAEFVHRLFTDGGMTVIDNTRQLVDSVIRGDTAVVVGGSTEVVALCQQAGACKGIVKAPFSPYTLTKGVGVLKNAPHKDATKVWVNWLLSKEGQETFVRIWGEFNDSGAISLRKDVAPHPKQLDLVPDYAHIDKLLVLGNDDGDRALDQVYKTYAEVKAGK